MTNTQTQLYVLLKRNGPLSHYALYHVARAHGYKFSPSSVRSRISELVKLGKVHAVGFEPTPSGRKARIWDLA